MWSSLLALVVISFGAGGPNAKWNTLTPKEVADGWLLLFDGATTFGWKIEGDAKVAGERLAMI